MSRRHRAQKREVLPDPRYGNVLISKFINCVMYCGKKSVAERIVYGALAALEHNVKSDPVNLFVECVHKVRPLVAVRSRRVGGATYQVPSEVPELRGLTLAMKWIIAAARKRSGKTMLDKLLGELSDIVAGRGAALKKREDTHRMAEANRAFAHYRW